MENLHQIISFLDETLETGNFKDASLNGLQVDSQNKEVKKVAVAVDSGLSIFEKAVAAHADLLIVHHGLFWGESLKVEGILAKKISTLMQGGCSLYASHLPLDAHLDYGNAAEMARFLNLKEIKGFCPYNGQNIGVKAIADKVHPIDYYIDVCSKIKSATQPFVFNFGAKEIKSIGIATGSGAFALKSCADDKLDLLISGEPKQEVYHLAKELKMNAIFCGHYATETFGVLALGKLLKEKYTIELEFIDEPTGV